MKAGLSLCSVSFTLNSSIITRVMRSLSTLFVALALLAPVLALAAVERVDVRTFTPSAERRDSRLPDIQRCKNQGIPGEYVASVSLYSPDVNLLRKTLGATIWLVLRTFSMG